MATPISSSILDQIVQLDGVIWAAHVQPDRSEILAMHADGSTSRNETVERVLAEAVLTAGDALGQRMGLGKATETHQCHPGGGLLFRRFGDDGQILAVRHAPGAALGRLRLTLSEAAFQLIDGQAAEEKAQTEEEASASASMADVFSPAPSPFAIVELSGKSSTDEDSLVYKSSTTA